jgi:hypothetical protein
MFSFFHGFGHGETWIILRTLGFGRFFLDLDLLVFVGFGRFFWIWILLVFSLGLDLDGFLFGSGLLVFFGSGSFWSSVGLDLFGFSSDKDLSVFSRVWISNGIFKKLLK